MPPKIEFQSLKESGIVSIAVCKPWLENAIVRFAQSVFLCVDRAVKSMQAEHPILHPDDTLIVFDQLCVFIM